MITFESKITKKGNLKVSPQVLDILGAEIGDTVIVSLDRDDIYSKQEMKKCSDCLHIPEDILADAGLCEDTKFEIYTDVGRVIIQEVDEDCDDYEEELDGLLV